jgi:acyl carrier protein
MSESASRDVLESIIVEVFELSPEDLPLSDDINIEYLGDSLKHLELFAIIERRLEVSVSNDDIRSFGDLVRFVSNRANAEKP